MRNLRALLIGYAIIILLTGWPVILAGTAGTLASYNGCTLNEARVHPCMIGGVDYGSTLYTLSMTPWFLIALIPMAVIAIVAWTSAWVIWVVVKRRRAATPAPGGVVSGAGRST